MFIAKAWLGFILNIEIFTYLLRTATKRGNALNYDKCVKKVYLDGRMQEHLSAKTSRIIHTHFSLPTFYSPAFCWNLYIGIALKNYIRVINVTFPALSPLRPHATRENPSERTEKFSQQVSDNPWERISIACIRARTACSSPDSISCRVLGFRDADKSSQKALDNVTNNGRCLDEQRSTMRNEDFGDS